MRRAVTVLLVAALCGSGARAAHAAAQDEDLARARALLAEGKLARALGMLRKLHRRAPSDLYVLDTLVDGLRMRRHDDVCLNADEVLSVTQALDTPASGPELAIARRLQLARALARACVGEAVASLEEAEQIARQGDPSAGATFRELALVFVGREQLTFAEEALARAVAHASDDPELLRDYAALLMVRGRAEQAAVVLARAHRVDPDDLGLVREYAAALASAGLASDALSLLSSHRPKCAESRGCIVQAARVALEARSERAALEWIGGERLPAALLLRAEALRRLGQVAEAREVYRDVLVEQPDNVRARQALEALENQ
jgi:tetratricopeptide (TPR) repeat protein